jgi:adenine deaminase
MQSPFSLSGNIVDVVSERIFKGTIEIVNGQIISIKEGKADNDQYIIPGLIDAHIHIESSMLVPSEFAMLAVVHGTVATVSDPHEIANVLGIKGVDFMIGNGKKVPFKFYFGAPSCVPATPFESAGATLGVEDTDNLLQRNEIKYLSEMMNFPGVLNENKEVAAKLDAARKYNKPVDGHAPGLTDEDLKKYIHEGITTDHECFTIEEALEKIKYGMKIQIREGSAAKNFDALIPLLKLHPDKIMLCSDDKHPDDLVEGHINLLVKRAIHLGYDPVKVLKACTYNPAKHYQLDVGLLQVGDPADLSIVDNLNDFSIIATYINGELVAQRGKSFLKPVIITTPNKFCADLIQTKDLEVKAGGKFMKVIRAFEGQLITEKVIVKVKPENGLIPNDPVNDILKIVVLNRYTKSKPSVGFITGFGLKKGAIASTVAHDSHNIISVGSNDEEIIQAINLLIASKGGISLVNGDKILHLPLPVAGIMSDENGYKVADNYKLLNYEVKNLGSLLQSPFMTLSFMALLVIPELKMSDKGLFDGNKFEFTSLFDD